MDHKNLVDAVAASMAMKKSKNPTPKEIEEERVEELKQDSDMFTIQIPMVTGRVFKVDARVVDWDQLGTPESQANLEQNEGIIRAMVHHLITADFTNPDTDKMLEDFDESLTNLFNNFGIEDCGYDDLQKKSMVKPYILILGKCFDALTLINVIAHNVAIHGLATKIFGITDSFKEVANLNDITDMDNSTDGLISKDRAAFEGIDDHDVSGLVSE